MLKTENIRNIRYTLRTNDIYIGGKWNNFDESPIVKPKGWSQEDFKQHLRTNTNPLSYYWEFLNELKDKQLSGVVHTLVCWDTRDGFTIIDIVNELIEADDKVEELTEVQTTVSAPISLDLSAFTSCQVTALDSFKKFINDPHKESFLLTGGAGVGKSYLMSAMIEMVGSDRSVILTPKHKMKKLHQDKTVLANVTIQSFFGLKPNYKQVDNRTGEIPFTVVSERKTEQSIYQIIGDRNCVFFFDETSMINEYVYGLICRFLPGYKKVYVGDVAQIEPIDEGESKTISNADITTELVSVVRYSGELLEYCNLIREEIISKRKVFSFHSRLNDSPMIETLPSEISAMFSFIERYNNGVDIRIIAFTNNKVAYFNDKLNQLLFPDSYDLGLKYFVGQKIQSNGKASDYKPCIRLGTVEYRNTLFVRQSIRLNKFDELTVKDVEIVTDTIISHESIREELTNDIVYIAFLDSFGLEQEVRRFGKEELLTLLDIKLEWYSLYCLSEKGNYITLRTLYGSSLDVFYGIISDLKKERYWLIANLILCMNDWVQPALSLTIDQSQGSTYEEVMLFTDGIQNERNIRRYYVGISRAKNKLYLV
jgi:hypothetical protein